MYILIVSLFSHLELLLKYAKAYILFLCVKSDHLNKLLLKELSNST